MRAVWKSVLTVGIMGSVAGMAGMAWLCSVIDFPVSWLRVLAAIPLLGGTISSGVVAGRTARRHGLYIGGWCGVILTAFWYCAASIHAGRLVLPFLFFVMIPAGMAGGTIGVNLPPYAIRRRLHSPQRIGRKTKLWLAALRKPPKYKNQTPDV